MDFLSFLQRGVAAFSGGSDFRPGFVARPGCGYRYPAPQTFWVERLLISSLLHCDNRGPESPEQICPKVFRCRSEDCDLFHHKRR
jgi:hypothetical protein